VGKTAIAQAIAKAFDTKFQQISLGGMVDSSILDGQHQGWLGSAPGRMVRILQQMGICDGVVLFDEIDKLGETQHGKEVQYSLLHITDPIQNKEYHDHYIGPEIPIDLSKLICIYAMNKTDGMDPALLSRLPLINVADYECKDKIQILTKYILPGCLKNIGLKSDDVILSPEAAKYLIEHVETVRGKEGGVRNVKDALTVILNKINILLTLTPEQRMQMDCHFLFRSVRISGQ
jgi:ATP-dependent Lon protease